MYQQVLVAPRPASFADRHALASLIHFDARVHRHLDWREPLDWLGEQPFILLENSHNQLIAALATPASPPEVAWVRLFAVNSKTEPQRAWQALWQQTLQSLRTTSAQVVAAIPMLYWFSELLKKEHFEHTHDVVMLHCEPAITAQQPTIPSGIILRPLNFDDLPQASIIDQQAFPHLWRASIDDLARAYQQAAVATVATDLAGNLLGYQISTAHLMGAHLARLAVYPTMQGRGIGSALVQDLLLQFRARGTTDVTVNTQHNNANSLRLYKKLGFRLTGERFPVYEYPLQ